MNKSLLISTALVAVLGIGFAGEKPPADHVQWMKNIGANFGAIRKGVEVEKNANVGRGNAIMGGVAKQFTNAELKALANYVSSLDGDLHTVPQSRFR